MYTFLVYLFDTEYEIDRVVICVDRKEFADFMLKMNERYEIRKIEVLDAEFGTHYREFCLPKSI